MNDLLKIVAFGAPAFGGVIAAIIGARQVRFLRQKTGDKSAVTTILSGEVFRAQGRKAA